MTDETRVVHTVVKVGGGLLSRAGALDLVVEALTAFSPRRRIVIIPGGGPFAEAVRTMFRRVKIGEDAAQDRKSTRLNSSHRCISYAVFCLKKKTNKVS